MISLRRPAVPISSLRTLRSIPCRPKTTSLSELQAAFRDPKSPYYIPPGTQGPEAEDSPSHTYGFNAAALNSPSDPLTKAKEKLSSEGFDPLSFWEQSIVWGDHDAFQHVNNVNYVRFFESARIKWMTSLGNELGGPEKVKAMLKAQGISLILKSIEVRFRRPVTYPDTLLIGYKPILPPPEGSPDNATFEVKASAYSISQEAFVAHSRESLVWYDYDYLKKCDPGDRTRAVVYGRAKAK
ncbi:hypothetical protein D9756_002166 [Leucocoprinus leucothites]|uniref:Thioesterase/thiol ester dehydrase-isomerase n=1 Tax=Leucocoprinus leucothites TaxID=201217 RepID=A0A8H5GB85_9AGAR|nr:hypothetical protein D9756_002166 [Leucoagaricus leucothites]